MSEETKLTPSIDSLAVGELIGMSEAAAKTGYNADFLRQLAAKGRLRARRTGNTWLTTLAAIEEYQNSRHQGKRSDLDRTKKTE